MTLERQKKGTKALSGRGVTNTRREEGAISEGGGEKKDGTSRSIKKKFWGKKKNRASKEPPPSAFVEKEGEKEGGKGTTRCPHGG